MSSSTQQMAAEEAPINSGKPPMVNILNAVAFFANFFVMFCMGIFHLHINAEVPASFPTLITPASWARLLWLFIVLVQFAWVVIQLLPNYRSEELVTTVGKNFIFASLAQIAWSIFFSYQILFLSFVSIIVMLVFLFIIFRAQSGIECGVREYFMLKFPFCILFGWIIVATFVDINVLLVAMGVSTTIQYYVALISLSGMLIVAASIPDLTVLGVTAWAMIGIFVELSNPDYYIETMFQGSYVTTVQFCSLFAFVALVAAIAWRSYSLWRDATKKPRIDIKAATNAEGEYVTMA